MDAEPTLTPQERLALSRRAITRQLMRRGSRDEGDSQGQGVDANKPSERRGAWWQLLRDAGLSWWHHHPAHTAAEVAAPVIKAYARERPIQVLGIAAASGAALMLLRPWRRVWFNRAVTGALGSMDFPGIALSVLNRNSNNHAMRNQYD
jgi:hypothetical protein